MLFKRECLRTKIYANSFFFRQVLCMRNESWRRCKCRRFSFFRLTKNSCPCFECVYVLLPRTLLHALTALFHVQPNWHIYIKATFFSFRTFIFIILFLKKNSNESKKVGGNGEKVYIIYFFLLFLEKTNLLLFSYIVIRIIILFYLLIFCRPYYFSRLLEFLVKILRFSRFPFSNDISFSVGLVTWNFFYDFTFKRVFFLFFFFLFSLCFISSVY